MNPPFQVQRPPNEIHQAAQWAALSTDATAQRAICHAAASGQLSPEQMVSFLAYIKGNGNAYRLYQLEIQALQQQQNQPQSLPQQFQPLKSQLIDNDPSHIPNPFISSPLSSIQSQHYSSPLQPSSSPPQPSRTAEANILLSTDPQFSQALHQYRALQDSLSTNPALSPADRENAEQRLKQLRELMALRMNHLGMRPSNASAASPPVSSSPPIFTSQSPAGQTSQPQHSSDVQRAHLSAAYQRQQQMMSNMPINPQPNGSIPRPLSRTLVVPVSATSSHPTLLSGRNSPTPNGNSTGPPTTSMTSIQSQSTSRPSSSHLASASSPPALPSSASPPTNNAGDLRRAVALKTGSQTIASTPPQIASPRGQTINLAPTPRPPSAASGSRQISPPAIARLSSPVAQPGPHHTQPQPAAPPQTDPAVGSRLLPASKPSAQQAQQYSAIAAQQQQQQASAPRDTQTVQLQPSRPLSPVPAPFPSPRPTLTGGHATASALTGTVLHRPPVNGIHEALGQPAGGNEAARGGGGGGGNAAGQESSGSNVSGRGILCKRKIQELVESIDPSERLEVEVEDLLLELADEFIDSVTRFSCQLAKHRKSDRLETKDIQLHLERSWNIRIPGFANDEIRQSQSRRVNALPSYQNRVTAVREAAKKRRPGS